MFHLRECLQNFSIFLVVGKKRGESTKTNDDPSIVICAKLHSSFLQSDILLDIQSRYAVDNKL